ncbi:hypothetical protein NI467_07400 [Acinetobacter bohemicus]|uniref:hypothetical protein n=1 Tax=Acinetobacter sp. S4397-1 TaxID=2972915 RepID=UPI00209A8697|nr:hypothetical protein [Acinetobacter sp. S4397-1]MCO8045170.1 hypothetical protein [Acinetobacter sp. S4397-1]
MNKWLICMSIFSLSGLSFADSSFETQLRSECAQVKNYAAKGKRLYDQKQYSKAVEQFEQQAAWSAFCDMHSEESGVSFSESSIATAFNNVGLSYAKLAKPQWARAWFSIYPQAKSSQFNLQQLPAPQKNSNLAGKYVRHAGFGAWSSIEVKPHQQSYQIQFNGLYMGLGSLIYGPNIGEFETMMPGHHTQTRYQQDGCKIELSFAFNPRSGQQLILEQDSGDSACGFGHNVSASGVYLKVE